ncbi:MAG: M23 family metallopeptidase [Acidiferrobacterales bacterium]|nr:M23 family metallopeptidase [Acidiferrobacterales bacterium]
MNQQILRKSISKIRVGLSICAAIMLHPISDAFAHNVGSAANRPFFQAPFPCGQNWEALTYAGHSPDPDSIDLSEFNSSNVNTSEGHAVLASASGTVIKSENSGSSGGWGVVIDHGDGWVTANSYHMQEDNPWPISVGQKVVQGQHLGRTGTTGATTISHQHYTQLDHYHLGTSTKNSVRVKFNGASVNTHAGNPSEWNAGEEILSQNCAGNEFMGWNSGGQRYKLIYKPNNGSAKIIRMNNNGSVTTTYSHNWQKGWTHFMPFYGVSNHPHAIIYNQQTGQAKFIRLWLQGDGITTLSEEQWSTRWTHFVPFTKNGDRYFLVYDSVHGTAKINEISITSDSSNTRYSGTWVAGRTAIVPYEEGPNRYMLLYKGGSGKAKIIKIEGSGNSIATSASWSGDWSTGYTTLVPMNHEGARYVFGYKAETGFAKVMKLNSNGQGVTTVKSMNWTKSWTAFSPFYTPDGGHLLIYKIGTGEVKTLRLKRGGNGFDNIWSGSWTLGWT